jgi:predicted permease
MVRSFYRVQQRELGFEPRGLLSLSVTLPPSSYPDSVVHPTFTALLARLANIPGVEGVSGANLVPFVDGNSIITFAPDLPEPRSREDAPDTDMRIVAPDYFHTLGIRVRRGSVDRFDDPTAGAVAMVSETAARTLWGPDVDPIGRRFRLSDPATGTAFTIVGVVSDIRAYSIENRRMRPMVYLPQAAWSGRTLHIAVRVSTSNTAGVAKALRAEVARLDPDLARPEVTSVADALSGTMDTRRFETRCVTAFACFALLLVMFGLFGLTSLMARQRRREIGIRVALGARPGRLVALLGARGAAVALVGTTLGTALAFTLAPRLGSLLFQTSPRDGVSFVSAIGAVVFVASLASALPAWRAGRSDPSEVLRGD